MLFFLLYTNYAINSHIHTQNQGFDIQGIHLNRTDASHVQHKEQGGIWVSSNTFIIDSDLKKESVCSCMFVIGLHAWKFKSAIGNVGGTLA
jgi:hypothetical protein